MLIYKDEELKKLLFFRLASPNLKTHGIPLFLMGADLALV